MDRLPTFPDRIILIVAAAGLCFSLWMSIAEPRSGSLFTRYLQVSLWIAILANIIAARMERNSPVSKRLLAISTLAVAFSGVGIFETFWYR